MINGYPVHIATRKYQKRKHHKRRINKKWQKRYGFREYDLMPQGQVLMINGTLYMTETTFIELKEILKNERRIIQTNR